MSLTTDPKSRYDRQASGRYPKCASPSVVDPSPQRTPFLLQAGVSKVGKDFAVKHSEAMFLSGMLPEKTAQVVRDTRALLRELGRPKESVKFIAGLFIVVD
jgi:alkanesulfonate monooxygenase SsuD/methylene tetrahydromethanopterin reductase-like flavin-dependent oxidoreductase (luciferase family)